MNEFYYDLLPTIFYHWILNKHFDNLETSYDDRSLYFYSEDYTGRIKFFLDNLVELSIIRKDSKDYNDPVFYLHFELVYFHSSVKMFNTFFDFFQEQEDTKKELNISCLEGKKILISCSSGFTSTMFAALMHDIAEEMNVHVQIDARGVLHLDKMQQDYDKIMIAPQVHYMLNTLTAKYGDKFIPMDTKSYATFDYQGLLQSLADSFK